MGDAVKNARAIAHDPDMVKAREIVEKHLVSIDGVEFVPDLRQDIAAAIKAEREACAEVAHYARIDDGWHRLARVAGMDIAAAIRARGGE